jgi:uncharacterized membrane protein YccC
LSTWMLRPLAASLNLRRSPEPALLRYTLRLTVLTLAGVAAFKLLDVPHGYWLPFTIVVVLQPDYGATRQRAVQRTLGTLAGSIFASAVLWCEPSARTSLAVIGASVFIFGYSVRRHYPVAIFFVTVFVVLMMEMGGTPDAAIAIERVVATALGGILAVVAAAIFWPLWERERFSPILSEALRANADYLEKLAQGLAEGVDVHDEAAALKRAAESSNAAVFASLKRMFGDPKNQREGIERAAAVANGNQRLTRIFNLLFVHVGARERVPTAQLQGFVRCVSLGLTTLAEDALQHAPDKLRDLAAELDRFASEVQRQRPVVPELAWLRIHMERAVTELSAMTLAMMPEAGEAAERPLAADAGVYNQGKTA